MELLDTNSTKRRRSCRSFSLIFSLGFLLVFVLFVTALAKFGLDNYENDLLLQKKKRFMMGK